RLHELVTAIAAFLQPAVDISKTVWQHPASQPEALVNLRLATGREGFYHHVPHCVDQRPMFARTVAAWLTVSKSFGWDFSKFSTAAVNPPWAASSIFGCFSVRLASWVETSRKWAMLRASSSWLWARALTSSRSVATN